MNAKKLTAEKAVTYIKDGMTVGMGTGSTVAYAIAATAERVRQGLKIKVVASSLKSEGLLKEAGIEVAAFNEVTVIDLYIDGADEVDRDFNLIKGGGGALTREKILAYNSKQYIVIVDDSKLVERLGSFPLPVEILPFAQELTIRNLEKLGCTAAIRQKNGKNFTTDNSNLIADCSFKVIDNVTESAVQIGCIPGVVESGLFASTLVSNVIVGYLDGKVDELEKK